MTQAFIRLKLLRYMSEAFPDGDGPDIRTMRRGIDRFEASGMVDKAIPGERIGNDYYVWVEPDTLRLAKNHAAQSAPAMKPSSKVKPVNDAAAALFEELGIEHDAA